MPSRRYANMAPLHTTSTSACLQHSSKLNTSILPRLQACSATLTLPRTSKSLFLQRASRPPNLQEFEDSMPPRLHAYNPPLELHASMPPRPHSCKAHPVPLPLRDHVATAALRLKSFRARPFLQVLHACRLHTSIPPRLRVCSPSLEFRNSRAQYHHAATPACLHRASSAPYLHTFTSLCLQRAFRGQYLHTSTSAYLQHSSRTSYLSASTLTSPQRDSGQLLRASTSPYLQRASRPPNLRSSISTRLPLTALL